MLKTYNLIHGHSEGLTFYKFSTIREDLQELVAGGGSSCEDGIPPLLQIILTALEINFEPDSESISIEEDIVAVYIA